MSDQISLFLDTETNPIKDFLSSLELIYTQKKVK